MQKKKKPTAQEYIKAKYAPPADTRSPKEASALFERIIKASVKGNPKPKPKKNKEKK